MKLYLFRHGETDYNKEGRIQCSMDIELNETGIKQAKRNAELLKDAGIEHIYSSPLKRAYKTGKIVADFLGVEIEKLEGIREINGGQYEGMLKTEFKKVFGEDNYETFFHTRNGGMDLSISDEETKQHIRDRVVNTINDICKNSKYNTIAIASHGLILREFLRGFDFEDDSGVKNCEIIEAEYSNGKLTVLRRIANQ